MKEIIREPTLYIGELLKVFMFRLRIKYKAVAFNMTSKCLLAVWAKSH